MEKVQLLFWGCVAGVFYIYLGYPLLICLLGWLFPWPVKKGAYAGNISVVIAAHNEASVLPGKLRCLLALPDAARISEVIVVSDGSTDGMVDAIRQLSDERIRMVEHPERRGKPSALNEGLPLCENEVVVLMDARQEILPGALSALASHFSDERIGVVSGELVFRSDGSATLASEGMGGYWRYEKWIRKSEARFDSVPGATGALYAIRKSLFRPLPQETLLDDVWIPMQIVAQGYRCIFEPLATVMDLPSKDFAREALRKRRTMAGNIQITQLSGSLLVPWKNPIWLQFMSHKILRLFSPFLLVGALFFSTLLWNHSLYRVLWLIQMSGLGMAGWVFWRKTRGKSLSGLGVLLMFVGINVITVLGWWDAWRGRFEVRWQRAGKGCFDEPRSL